MPKDFYIKLSKNVKEQHAKADGNICKDYSNSAKANKAFTPDQGEDYYHHLMEFALWRRNWLNC